MALQLTRTSILCRMTRQFYRNSNNKTKCVTTKCMSTSTPKEDGKSTNGVHDIGTYMHPVTDFDKRLLVWVKRYPKMEEVPKYVTRDCMLQARSRARIRVCNILIGVTLVSFLISIFSGKKEAAAGKSLTTIRQEWYEGLRREHEAEQAALAAKAENK